MLTFITLRPWTRPVPLLKQRLFEALVRKRKVSLKDDDLRVEGHKNALERGGEPTRNIAGRLSDAGLRSDFARIAAIAKKV